MFTLRGDKDQRKNPLSLSVNKPLMLSFSHSQYQKIMYLTVNIAHLDIRILNIQELSEARITIQTIYSCCNHTFNRGTQLIVIFSFFVITARKRGLRRLCFTGVCLSTGGISVRETETPLDRDPPRQRPPSGQRPPMPWTETEPHPHPHVQ